MGAIFSSLSPIACSFCRSSSQRSPERRPSIADLPESCVALILAFLDPPDICNLARLNRAFRGASWADFVWESKLPENYPILYGRLLGNDLEDGLCKRQIYAGLCRVNTFDSDTKKAWLDKNTGGVCLSISYKGLIITGIDDRRYWSHVSTDESRFHAIAYLQQTWWFEAKGEFEFPFPPGTYSMFFRLQLGRTARRFGRRICKTDQIHGWDIKPVQFQLWTTDGQYASTQRFLGNPGKWILYHVGDFVVTSPEIPVGLRFSLSQIDCTHTKGGVSLDSLLVRPSDVRGRNEFL